MWGRNTGVLLMREIRSLDIFVREEVSKAVGKESAWV